MDSVVLLHLLRVLAGRLDFSLSAVHINHQISLRAEAWADFCQQLCGTWEIDLIQRRVSVGGRRGIGIEAAARAERYRAFSMVDSDWIVLGHHREDQAETVLLNLLRGSGVRGVAAMPEVRAIDGGGPRLLRPLLGVSRRALEAYARQHNLSWVDDESNENMDLRRNFLRRGVLPLLDERFPGCRKALARAAKWAAETESLLDELAAADGSAWLDAQRRLDTRGLGQLSAARGRNLLRHWLQRADLRMPDSSRLVEIQSRLAEARPGQQIRIEIEGGVIRCYRGWASIEPRQALIPVAERIWRGESCVGWGAGRIDFHEVIGDGLSRRALAGAPVVLRMRRGGERIRLDAYRPRRSLKNLYQEAGIPPWRRSAMPLLWCGEDLVWVPGVGIAWEYRCAPDEPGVLPHWRS